MIIIKMVSIKISMVNKLSSINKARINMVNRVTINIFKIKIKIKLNISQLSCRICILNKTIKAKTRFYQENTRKKIFLHQCKCKCPKWIIWWWWIKWIKWIQWWCNRWAWCNKKFLCSICPFNPLLVHK